MNNHSKCPKCGSPQKVHSKQIEWTCGSFRRTTDNRFVQSKKCFALAEGK